ncbi:ABC transporter substrate-binding protein [Bosea caraganae]|uniref:ABC transporter substrate-binding protein n=1 Tax=Bosea caraganae TaxID=2763117 RepID=UPI0015F09CDC|nr:ABC transporter substrate-binding protein [Bosea caraganae]
MSAPAFAQSAGKEIEKVTIAVGDEPPTFDAHKAVGAIATYFTTNVYEGLTEFDTSNKLNPALATEWSVSGDGLAYEFKLRRNVKFHTGEPFTAKDVVFSFKRYRDPKVQPRQVTMEHLKDIELVDDYTVRIILSRIDPTFLNFLAHQMNLRILSKDYYDKVGDAGFEKAPVGTGPYKFVRRAIKEFWELERFDDYWGAKPAAKRAIFRVIPEAVTLASVLKTGEVDMVCDYPPVFIKDVESAGGFRVIRNKGSNTIDIRINCIRETVPGGTGPNPYRDRRVRLAMNYAIDKDTLIKRVLNGNGDKVAILFPEDIGYDPELKPYPYDPKKAKELLAEAGYPNGLDATFYGLVGQRMPMSKEVGEVVAQYLTAVGIRTKVVNEEYGIWLKRSDRTQQPELYPFGYGLTFVGGTFHSAFGLKYYGYSGMPNSWFESKDYDAVVDQIYKTIDPKEVEQLARKAAKILHDEAGYVTLYRVVLAYAMKDSLQFTPTAISNTVELKNLRPA